MLFCAIIFFSLECLVLVDWSIDDSLTRHDESEHVGWSLCLEEKIYTQYPTDGQKQ